VQVNVVTEILERSIRIADELHQEEIMVAMDEAVYALAQRIRWQTPVMQKRIVLRLGEFHTCMMFLGTIGKRFKDGGFRDIVIESGIVAERSVNGVLSGKHYNRSLRTVKLLQEALLRLVIDAYYETLSHDDQEEMKQTGTLLFRAYSDGNFKTTANSYEVTRLITNLRVFVSELSESSPTFKYWMSFVHMVSILLQFIRATRIGDWDLHLAAIRYMLRWVFAYD